MLENTAFLITCEHGGNDIPAEYRALFIGQQAILDSHRGYDAGALVMARELANALNAPLVASTTSRLLIDLNRSPGHPHLHSQFIPEAERLTIKASYYQPYRDRAQTEVARALEQHDCVIHISSHSFTPALNGAIRNADIGLLYDPDRNAELELCVRWKSAIKVNNPDLRVRRNYPYTGKSDGLCAWMRKHFPARRYLGIELEINQMHVLHGGPNWPQLRSDVIRALLEAAFDHREKAGN